MTDQPINPPPPPDMAPDASADAPPDAPPPPLTARQQAGEFLSYVGPLVTIAGGLAMIRLWKVDWFFAALMPIGVVMWWVGRRMAR